MPRIGPGAVAPLLSVGVLAVGVGLVVIDGRADPGPARRIAWVVGAIAVALVLWAARRIDGVARRALHYLAVGMLARLLGELANDARGWPDADLAAVLPTVAALVLAGLATSGIHQRHAADAEVALRTAVVVGVAFALAGWLHLERAAGIPPEIEVTGRLETALTWGALGFFVAAAVIHILDTRTPTLPSLLFGSYLLAVTAAVAYAAHTDRIGYGWWAAAFLAAAVAVSAPDGVGVLEPDQRSWFGHWLGISTCALGAAVIGAVIFQSALAEPAGDSRTRHLLVTASFAVFAVGFCWWSARSWRDHALTRRQIERIPTRNV